MLFGNNSGPLKGGNGMDITAGSLGIGRICGLFGIQLDSGKLSVSV